MDKKEKIATCALNTILGFEPRIAHALIENLGSANAVFEMNPDELRGVLGPSSKYKFSFTAKALDEAEEVLEGLEKIGAAFLSVEDESYPALLKECPDAPIGLYVKSEDSIERIFDPGRPAIAIVGTRDSSPYGCYWTPEIVSALASCPVKPVIISGLALGTDVMAHRAALEWGLSTIAVMATGIERVYPAAHWGIAKKIASTPSSALVTDYPPGTSPIAINFMRRNRIIAGLSDSIIVIESKIKGGSLITARFATEYSHGLYALPGRIDDPRSEGCNFLLKAKMAEPIFSLEELVKDLGLGEWNLRRKDRLEEALMAAFEGNEKMEIIKETALLIKNKRGLTAEELSHEGGLPYREVALAVSMLESSGFIEEDLLGRCWIKSKKG